MDSRNPDTGTGDAPRRDNSAKGFLPLRRKEVTLITDAEEAPGQSRRRRELVYGVLQFIRIPSLLLAFYLIYAHQAWLWAALVVAVTLPLPWVAVVQANDHGKKQSKRERNVYKPAIARQMQAQYEAELEAQRRAALEANAQGEAQAPGSPESGGGGSRADSSSDVIEHEEPSASDSGPTSGDR